MEPYKIFYIGPKSGTCLQRAEALRRIGCTVIHHDPLSGKVLNNRYIGHWIIKTGALLLGDFLFGKIRKAFTNDVGYTHVWVDSLYAVNRRALAFFKQRGLKIIAYNPDDPFGTRDGKKWRLFLNSIDLYDLVTVVRRENIKEAERLNAKCVHFVFRSADEVAHHVERSILKEYDILFVGTYFPERGPFFAKLIQAGLPVSIYGDNWQKSEYWPIIKSAWKGASLHGATYAEKIKAARICLGLLSKGNRDLHTQRSAEIPFIGSVFCAERTSDHLEMYNDEIEAVFFDNAEECIEKCKALVEDNSRLVSIAKMGNERVIKNGYLNEPTLRTILNKLERLNG